MKVSKCHDVPTTIRKTDYRTIFKHDYYASTRTNVVLLWALSNVSWTSIYVGFPALFAELTIIYREY